MIDRGACLELSRVSIKDCIYETTVFDVKGSISIRDSIFENISLTSASLIRMHGSSSSSIDGSSIESIVDVSIERCSFSSISSLDWNGSVINSEIETGDKLIIYGMKDMYIICTMYMYILIFNCIYICIY
jgi:hypothetical protein